MRALSDHTRLLRHHRHLEQAAALIAAADGLLIGAGAGMSVESGLAPYRGRGGQWLRTDRDHEGFTARDRASAAVFRAHPQTTAAHHAHRWAQARACVPHPGYQALLELARSRPAGTFVFTSNVDTMFARAGFDPARIYECHGALSRSQCPACPDAPVFDSPTDGSPARCPDCGSWARPNVLMFDDWAYNPAARTTQWDAWGTWLRERTDAHLVVLEIGAGQGIPAVRHRAEALAATKDRPLIRINRFEPQLPATLHGVPLRLPAGQALTELRARQP